MKKILLPVLMILSFYITSCKKSSSDKPKTYLISSDIDNYGTTNDTTLYKYDDRDRIIEIYHRTTGPSANNFRDKLIYGENDHLIQSDTFVSDTLHQRNFFSYYNDTTITEHATYYFKNANNLVRDNVFTLNKDHFVIKLDYGNNYYYKLKHDARGNLTSYSYYTPTSNVVPYYSYSYNYDNNKSKYSNVKGNFYIYYNQTGLKNDLTSYNFSDSKNYHVTLTYSYENNSDGYPTKATATNDVNSNVIVHNYTYLVR